MSPLHCSLRNTLQDKNELFLRIQVQILTERILDRTLLTSRANFRLSWFLSLGNRRVTTKEETQITTQTIFPYTNYSKKFFPHGLNNRQKFEW
jgi:hypothetical protein